ncbi:hypothetical protein L7F22_027975 [Adiantum nelumboides]|nr:hypothetical protein [Adiantum nelumboides]
MGQEKLSLTLTSQEAFSSGFLGLTSEGSVSYRKFVDLKKWEKQVVVEIQANLQVCQVLEPEEVISGIYEEVSYTDTIAKLEAANHSQEDVCFVKLNSFEMYEYLEQMDYPETEEQDDDVPESDDEYGNLFDEDCNPLAQTGGCAGSEGVDVLPLARQCQKKMDGNKEEGSSSEDRQPIPTAHEIGESSGQAEKALHVVTAVTMFKQLMENPRFMEFIQSSPIAHQVQGSFGMPGTVFRGMQGMVPNPIPYVDDVPEDMPAEDQPKVEELDEIFVPEQILAHKKRKEKARLQGAVWMDGNKEEGSSLEERQPISIAHEIGKSSGQAEKDLQVVIALTMFKQLMENPRFMEFMHSSSIAHQVQGSFGMPGTVFRGMQGMVPNPMYANIGSHLGFQGTQGQLGVSQGNLGMAGFSIPSVNMTPGHQHVSGQGVQMAPTGVPIMQTVSFDNLESMDKIKPYKKDEEQRKIVFDAQYANQ